MRCHRNDTAEWPQVPFRDAGGPGAVSYAPSGAQTLDAVRPKHRAVLWFNPRGASFRPNRRLCTPPRAVAVKGGAPSAPAEGLALDGHEHGGTLERLGGEELPTRDTLTA